MIIYKITNNINNKIYVGSDKNNNPNYLGSGKLIKLAIKKHGKENFKKEILEVCKTLSDLKQKEKYWIKHLKANKRNIGYNISDGYFGGDTFTNSPNKEITRRKLSILSKGKNNPMYKKSIYDLRRETLSEEEVELKIKNHKLKLSLALKGKSRKNLTTIRNEKYNKKEVLRRQKQLSEKRSENAKKANGRSIKIYVYKNNKLKKEFESRKSFLIYYNLVPNDYYKNINKGINTNSNSTLYKLEIRNKNYK